MRNLRVILPTGHTLRATGYEDASKIILMGDSAGKTRILNAEFTAPDEAYNAVRYSWDTVTSPDGSYEIKATKGADAESITVRTDNTAPVITTNLQEISYKGIHTINAEEKKQLCLPLSRKTHTCLPIF